MDALNTPETLPLSPLSPTSLHFVWTREHIPGVGTNHRGLESLFQGSDPIAGDFFAQSFFSRW
eukprot:216653-Pyramimonas_sp.AAC.1